MFFRTFFILWTYFIDAVLSDEPSLNPADLYVDSLPGLDSWDGQYPVMHSGVISLNDSAHGGNMFFWRLEAEQYLPGRRNTVIWLNGGPGCSSMDGMMMEIGAFRVTKDAKLTRNPGSWNKYSTVVFIDQPFGVGFSTIDYGEVTELNQTATYLTMFLDHYYKMFPEERKNDLYLAGESFAGQYIPYLAKYIIDRNGQLSSHDDPQHVHLAGIAIGNGWIDPIRQYLAYQKFIQKHNLIDPTSVLAKHFEDSYKQCANTLSLQDHSLVHVPKCEEMLQQMMREYDNQERCLNVYDIRLTDTYPSCGLNWPPDIKDVTSYLSRSDVHKALHIENHVDKWVECSNKVGGALKALNSQPAIEFFPEIMDHIPVMLFAGDQDFLCNTDGLEMLIDSLGFGPVAAHMKDLEVAGSSKAVGSMFKSGNLSYYKIYGGSHMPAYDLPEITQSMFYEFLGVDANSTTIIPDSPAKDKLVNDAMWKAYYQAGAVALIIVLIAAAALIWFVFIRKRQRSVGVRFTDDVSEVSLGNIFKSLATGMTRWVPGRSKKNRYYGADASAEELADFEIGSESDEELDALSSTPSDEGRNTPIELINASTELR